MGFKTIAVTVNGFTEEDISRIPDIEKKYGITAVCIMVCTTGIDQARTDLIAGYADLVWSCASGEVRDTVGKKSILQITQAIPVFVLTKKGLDFAACYANKPEIIQELDSNKQYLAAAGRDGTRITLGNQAIGLIEAELPVRSKRQPH